jgi:hypothetical protein
MDYELLVNRLGLPAYWRSQGNSPDICRDAARPSYCGVT